MLGVIPASGSYLYPGSFPSYYLRMLAVDTYDADPIFVRYGKR